MGREKVGGNLRGFPAAVISRVEVTEDTLTGRGGLALFSRHLRHIGILEVLEERFGALRRSGKGRPVGGLFHQIFCFLLDGTSRHLVHFDRLKGDEGHARGIETEPEAMASSHAVKRFFGAFGWGRIWTFRRVLRQLWLWRLRLEKPEVIVLGLDTMVMDNDEAELREGCQPTYRKVKGFQPLQLTWGPFVVDGLFRGGKKNGNAGEAAANLVRDSVAFLRRHYRRDAAILLRLDAGFFDKKLFRRFEELEIGYVCGGRLQADIVDAAQGMKPEEWFIHDNGHQLWEYFEFHDRRESWRRGEWRRALYTCPAYEDAQRLLESPAPTP
ncbi:MAG: transposase [Gemmatimonadota bacterium]